MFEEEFVVTLLNSTSGQPFVHKYFSDIVDASQLQEATPDATNTIERGNLLGSTLVAHAPWTAPLQTRRQCLLKLYDSDIHEFKLRDVVTFVGVLEYRAVSSNEDSQMTDH